MAPRRPKLVDAANYPTWDQYVQEATGHIEPFVLPLPPPPDAPEGYVPEQVEVPCPTGGQMTALAMAQQAGDDNAAFVAIFGEDLAPRLLAATADLPFVVRAKLVQRVMMHYGTQVADLGG